MIMAGGTEAQLAKVLSDVIGFFNANSVAGSDAIIPHLDEEVIVYKVRGQHTGHHKKAEAITYFKAQIVDKPQFSKPQPGQYTVALNGPDGEPQVRPSMGKLLGKTTTAARNRSCLVSLLFTTTQVAGFSRQFGPREGEQRSIHTARRTMWIVCNRSSTIPSNTKRIAGQC
jgi:hypothetical protein